LVVVVAVAEQTLVLWVAHTLVGKIATAAPQVAAPAVEARFPVSLAII
jgi:hypothetical protein